MGRLIHLSDAELIRCLKELLARERCLEAELVAHVAEVDARKLYAERGFDSMFRYCTEELGLSDSVAFHRIHVARIADRFPRILQDLAEGKVNLSGAVVLGPHFTPNNHARLLDAVAGQSVSEIKELVAAMFPKPAVPAYVARIPGDSRTLPMGKRALGTAAVVEPLRPEQYKVQFTADREFRDRLDELQALLRHQVPNGDLAEIFGRAIELLLEDTKRKRFAKTDRPHKAEPSENPSRSIPAEIKRDVYERDGGRCTYESRDGRSCGSKAFLEYHHEAAWARNGRHRAEEITLRCRAHNHLAACREFGRDFMRRFTPAADPPGRTP